MDKSKTNTPSGEVVRKPSSSDRQSENIGVEHDQHARADSDRATFFIDQGEYGIADRGQTLKTDNVQQCVLIHIRDTSTGIHGLAHVDGHSIMASSMILEDSHFFSKPMKKPLIYFFYSES